MMAWLTRAPAVFFTAFSCDFCYFSRDFYCSKSPLNVTECLMLTGAEAHRSHPAPPWRHIFYCISICYTFNVSSKHSCYIASNRGCAVQAFANRPAHRFEELIMPQHRTRAEAINRIRRPSPGRCYKASSAARRTRQRPCRYEQARALLVSHWKVDSGATVKLITGAMRQRAANKAMGRAEAMRQSMPGLIGHGEPCEVPPAYHPAAE
jgi:hypothetical protein